MNDITEAKSVFSHSLRFTDTQMLNSTSWNISKQASLLYSTNTASLMKEKASRDRNTTKKMQKHKKKDGLKNIKTNIKRMEDRQKKCETSWGSGYYLCCLVKAALRKTYTDSSDLLKEGHKKVMCASYCELVKTKPVVDSYRDSRQIILLEASLVARSKLSADILREKSPAPVD